VLGYELAEAIARKPVRLVVARDDEGGLHDFT
jgi:hypothetical protein